MLLSPLEIQQKQFPNRFRGLDAKEVESFLQKVADQMSIYLKHIDELKREVEEMERQLGEHKEREQTLKNTLCLLYTSPSPRDTERSRMPSSA